MTGAEVSRRWWWAEAPWASLHGKDVAEVGPCLPAGLQVQALLLRTERATAAAPWPLQQDEMLLIFHTQTVFLHVLHFHIQNGIYIFIDLLSKFLLLKDVEVDMM